MSRAHALAPLVGADGSFRGPVQRPAPPASKVARRSVRPTTSCYLERAMLLWPRLDRARISKVADDPVRIAEIVERRTSQPFNVILAMLTKVSPALSPQAEPPAAVPLVRADGSRVSLRIVRSEEGAEIAVQDLAGV